MIGEIRKKGIDYKDVIDNYGILEEIIIKSSGRNNEL